MLLQEDAILNKKVNCKKATLGGHERQESIPFASDMAAFMKDYSCAMCQSITQAVLVETCDNFADAFWDKFRDRAAEDIINVNEMSVYYDMPPGKTLTPIAGSSKVDTSQNYSDRTTAVLTIRSNSEPGGSIETKEVPTYLAGHVYAVQYKAWMDKHVWQMYLTELLKFEITRPTVILADNLDCHVSESSVNTVSTELFGILASLPKNSTTVEIVGPKSQVLQELSITTWNNTGASAALFPIRLTDTMLGAGGVEGEDSCRGDSGGPLT
ncbi:hypothetical protein DYB35_013725, partial [Aphanomyces astaci]